MIPPIRHLPMIVCRSLLALTAACFAGSPSAAPAAAATAPAAAAGCLPSGDGYLRAHLAGAIVADIDWPNGGTVCEGESKPDAGGVRLSFRRVLGSHPNLVFVFGLSGVREGQALQAVGANLTIIVQGTSRIYGTLGDTRCTVDRLTQRPLAIPHVYRVEVRGFCTQPAHAVRGEGDVLVSRFDFAGQVNYALDDAAK